MWNVQASSNEPGYVGTPSGLARVASTDPQNGVFRVLAIQPDLKFASLGQGFYNMADAFAAALEGYRTTGVTHEVFSFGGQNVTEPARKAYLEKVSD